MAETTATKNTEPTADELRATLDRLRAKPVFGVTVARHLNAVPKKPGLVREQFTVNIIRQRQKNEK